MEIEFDGLQVPFAGRKRSRGAPGNGGDQRDVIRASRVVRTVGGGTIEQLGIHRIDAESPQVVGVETAPVPRARENGYPQNRDQENMFCAIESIVVDVVLDDIQVHILLRENDEGIKEDPPAEQHKEVKQAEQDFPFFVLQVGTPAHGGEHGHCVEEQDDIKNEGVGDLTVKNGFPDGPGCLIGHPAGESQSHQGPEAALLAGAAPGVGQGDCHGGEHEQQAGYVGKGRQGEAGVRDQRHCGKGQSDAGRCNKPAVLAKRSHPETFYGSYVGRRRTAGRVGLL